MSLQNKKHFTLVEVLVVMAIIGILLSMGLVVSRTVQDASKESFTDGQMSKISLALEEFKAEYGMYYTNVEILKSGKVRIGETEIFNPDPMPEERGVNIKANSADQDYIGALKFCSRKEQGKYMNASNNDYRIVSFLGADYEWCEDVEDELSEQGIRDGWGNLFRYVYPGKHNNSKYDLWSPGPDGLTDYENPSADVNLDDIKNW